MCWLLNECLQMNWTKVNQNWCFLVQAKKNSLKISIWRNTSKVLFFGIHYRSQNHHIQFYPIKRYARVLYNLCTARGCRCYFHVTRNPGCSYSTCHQSEIYNRCFCTQLYEEKEFLTLTARLASCWIERHAVYAGAILWSNWKESLRKVSRSSVDWDRSQIKLRFHWPWLLL